MEPEFQDYYRVWVLGFFGFIKPKKVAELAIEKVEKFIAKLSAEGKKERQLRQAEEGVRVFFQEVEPQKWAKLWPPDLLDKFRLGIEEFDQGAGMWGAGH